MSDWPILRDKRESKPRLGSSAGDPLQKMSNVVAPHDTDPASTEDPRKFLPYTIFLFLLTFSFLLSISRPPPRGLVVSPEILHTFCPVCSWRREWDSNPR